MNEANDTLLDFAINNLKAERAISMAYPNDDGMLNQRGYHLQQAIELTLKHILEPHGIKFPKTHDIDDLIDILPPIYEQRVKELKEYSRNITQLESKTRYLKGYRAGFELVTRVAKYHNTHLP